MREKKMVAIFKMDHLELLHLIKTNSDKKNEQNEGLYLLKNAVLLENWQAALILLAHAPLNIPDDYFKILVKFKDQILSADNLKSIYITEDHLNQSLTKANHLGRLAYSQRGLLAPSAHREFIFSFQRGALGRIQAELIHRSNSKKSLDEKEAKKFSPIEQVSILAEIDQLSREPEAQQDADLLTIELRKWFHDMNPTANNLMSILTEIFATLLDKGYKTKDKYPDMLIPTKLHFQSPYAMEERVLGWFRNKNGLHIGQQAAKEFSTLKVVYHELVHLLLTYITGDSVPNPRDEWQKLTNLVMDDIKQTEKSQAPTIKKSYYDDEELHEDEPSEIPIKKFSQASQLSDRYKSLVSLKNYYPEEAYLPELASFLIEIYIENFGFPKGEKEIISASTIEKIQENFEKLIPVFKKFRNDLIQSTQNKTGRIELFHYLKTGNIDKFTQLVCPQQCRGLNLYPLHYCVKKANLKLLEKFLRKGFSIDSIDKFGTTPLICAIRSKQDVAIIRALIIEYHANIALTDKSGNSALFYAEKMGLSEEVLNLLTPKTPSLSF